MRLFSYDLNFHLNEGFKHIDSENSLENVQSNIFRPFLSSHFNPAPRTKTELKKVRNKMSKKEKKNRL